MRTNEVTRQAYLELAETAMEELLGTLEKVEEGDLDQVEQTMFQAVLELGRKRLSSKLRKRENQNQERDVDTCAIWSVIARNT